MRIAIVGGGASGVIAAIHLIQKLGSRAKITIFDPAAQLGAGLAYSTDHPVHLLNVPAEKMSAFEDRPGEFRDWLERHHPDALSGPHYPFVPRGHFRQYLQSKIPAEVTWRREKIEGLRRVGSNWEILGERFDVCVQATGYSQTELSKTWPKNPKAVAIAGSGLTAIDHWRRLRHEGYEGAVHFVSPRALFPLSHLAQTYDIGEMNLDFSSPLNLLRTLRREKGERTWPIIADALRPRVVSIWTEWSERQRNQFRQHLRPYWEVIRHRLPSTVHSELQRELNSGLATIHRGRIRSGEAWRDFAFTEIIDATGAGLAPVPKIEGEGQRLFVVGPAGKDKLWEVTAVPEIRRQAAALAEEIALAICLC